jgi:hypothetical protein
MRIGCDLHSRQQMIAMLDTDTGGGPLCRNLENLRGILHDCKEIGCEHERTVANFGFDEVVILVPQLVG